jgi:hypothetical protein
MIPKQVPLIIAAVSPDIMPQAVVIDNLKCFHSTIILLTNACSRTKVVSVTLSINVQNGQLIFISEDSTPDVDIEPYIARFFWASSFDPTRLDKWYPRLLPTRI